MTNQKILNTKYYLIKNRILGKREYFGGNCCKEWLYQNGEWVKDVHYVINDHLVGYDPYEPEGSPYGFGSSGILFEMEEITEEEGMAFMVKEGNDERRIEH